MGPSLGLIQPPLFTVLSFNPTVSQNGFSPYSILDPQLHIIIKLQLWTGNSWTSTFAMVDSGCSTNAIDLQFLQNHHLALIPKSKPLQITMADGSDSVGGSITHQVSSELVIGPHREMLTLDVTKIHSYPIILGIPWLKLHDPWIQWSTHRLTFNSPYCLQSCCISEPSTISAEIKYPRYSPPSLVPIAQVKSKSDKSYPPRSSELLKPVSQCKKKRKPKNASSQDSDLSLTLPPERSPPKVSLINSVAFHRCLKQSDTQLFQISIADLSIEPPGKTDPDMAQIPEEYHEFADVFNKENSDQLPPHRPYDHAIPLQEGTTPPFGPIYSLSPSELQTLREYIDENLRRGFIRHSQSPAAAPILFVKKADGSLRLCVDYRGLNKITIKNRYPLPLIGEIFGRVGKAKFFTKFDVREGYHRLRIAKGEEWKTAFRCRYGLYEYQVMPFGLCNAPGTFQHFINDIFHDFLDDFLVSYLDDLLIYSNTLKEHKQHVRLVLKRLQEHGLYLKPSKCKFHTDTVSFLGFVISPQGINMDQEKIESITTWPTPTCILDIQTFLGFANFYRRFIRNYSRIILPITNLLKKDTPFNWNRAADHAFKQLKKAFTTAPILRHFDPEKPAILETDASDYAEGGIVSQCDDDGVLHPCAFYSRKFTPAELNYEIYDKEMLAIVDCLTTWRHYFEGSPHQLKIYTDHKNLVWFTETKLYNRRQARWAEKLASFDFVIHYRPGTLGGKPDALSRRPDYRPLRGGGTTMPKSKNPNEFQFLKPQQLQDFPTDKERTAIIAQLSISATIVQPLDQDESFLNEIKSSLKNDQAISPYLSQLEDPTLPRDEATKTFLIPFTIKEELVFKDGLIYIPNHDNLKLQVLKTCHDSPLSGHLGQDKTFELITRNYTWPGMRKFINDYIKSCDSCNRSKTSRHKPHGYLQPLPIPLAPWKSVSMDFIVELPISQGFNAILVCVDRLTKMAHFCPTTTNVTAEESSKLYLHHVFKLHGLPNDVVSDRGPQFTARFTNRLLQLCKIQSNKSTAFHPQSDGQTERVNQILEQYLRVYCDYQQQDWYELLPLAEFAYNNAKHASTKFSPFYANYGHHPRATLHVPEVSLNPAAEDLMERLKRVHEMLKQNLQSAQENYKKFFDKRVKEAPLFKVGDLVWLSRRNIVTTRPSPKLDYKKLGPYKILEVIGESRIAFKLELPLRMKIHPVFHVSLLEPYYPNIIPGRVQTPPPPVIVDGFSEYEVKEILDSRIRHNKLQYLVDWVGYRPDERTWEPLDNLENASDAIGQFHRKHPQRPNPRDLRRS